MNDMVCLQQFECLRLAYYIVVHPGKGRKGRSGNLDVLDDPLEGTHHVVCDSILFFSDFSGKHKLYSGLVKHQVVLPNPLMVSARPDSNILNHLTPCSHQHLSKV